MYVSRNYKGHAPQRAILYSSPASYTYTHVDLYKLAPELFFLIFFFNRLEVWHGRRTPRTSL